MPGLDHHVRCQISARVPGGSCTCEALALECIRSQYPELDAMENSDLRNRMFNDLYRAICAMKLMRHRGMDDVWWSIDEVLAVIDPISEEHGWEGVGR